MDPVRFFCDDQLGRLARWLRILGLDAAWERSIDDRELLARARAEGRVVLTRDTRLRRLDPDAEVVLLTENYPALQLREVVGLFRDRLRVRVFSRCPLCNSATVPVAREAVAGQVPPFVFATQREFTRCPACGKIYWRATHKQRVDKVLSELLGDLVAGAEKKPGK